MAHWPLLKVSNHVTSIACYFARDKTILPSKRLMKIINIKIFREIKMPNPGNETLHSLDSGIKETD
jgi:hypothetical protein